MRFLKILGIILLSLLVIVVVIGFMQPSELKVEASTISKAPVSVLYDQVNDIEKRIQWSPWEGMDSNMTITLGETTMGVGASYSWTSEIMGNGRLEYVDCEPNKHVIGNLYFNESGAPGVGAFIFEPVEDGTKVTWTMSNDLGSNPFMRLLMSMQKPFMTAIFQQGVNSLDSVASAVPVNTSDIQKVVLPAFTYLSVLDSCSMEEFGAHIAKDYGLIMMHTKGQSSGAPMAIYHSFDEATLFSVFEAAIPVDATMEGTDEISKNAVEERLYLRGTHYGPYEEMGDLWNEMEAFIAENGIEVIGNPMEVYETEPGTEPDTSKWLTYIYYPISE